MGRLIALALVLPWLSAVAPHRGEQPAASDERIVLVTIDGARTEEVFGGLDVAVLQSTLRASQRVEETSAYERYWAPTREERRRTLMPFFWSLVTREGSIAGDAESGSHVRLGNSHWFSYPHVLDAFNRTDGYLRELWTRLQSQADYRGRTHLLVTTDRGRGHTTKDWRDHGAKVDGANEVWIAFASPRMSARGLWRDHPPLSTSQIVATLAAWAGLDWTSIRPNAGRPIRSPAP
jgi:hypothetical protein